MKIVAALSWYMEPPAFLERLVSSLAGHVDGLIALDGAWRGFEPYAASSGREERDMIRASAAEHDLDATIVVPKCAWRSQIEKRQHLFDLATASGSDWILVVDGDWELDHCDDAALRQSLELTGADVAMVMMRPLNRQWPWSEMPKTENPERHLWRAQPGLTVENLHYGIRVGSRWLHGDPAYVTVEDALDLSAVIGFAHDNLNRSPGRNRAMRDYRKTRQTEGLESWR